MNRRGPDRTTVLSAAIVIVLAAAWLGFGPLLHHGRGVTSPPERRLVWTRGDGDPADPPPADEPLVSQTWSATSAPSRGPITPPANGVLFDGKWSVTEGVWYVGEDIPDQAGKTGVFGSVDDHRALSVLTPALYGDFRVRMEFHDQPPAVPSWCEDAFEASFRVRDAVGLVGFENYSPLLRLPAGTYRVRFCVRGLDQVPEDPHSDGAIAPGRYLFQFWQAPVSLDRTLFAHSAFARHAAS